MTIPLDFTKKHVVARSTRTAAWALARFASALVLCIAMGSAGRAADPAPQTPWSDDGVAHFRAVDIFVNAGDHPLGAYQVELKSKSQGVQLVGIEGGEHPAFQTPPYYDPSALLRDRVIVAAFSTAESLPHGKTRVARLMVRTMGNADPLYDGTIEAAATADGSKIAAQLTVTPVLEGKKP